MHNSMWDGKQVSEKVQQALLWKGSIYKQWYRNSYEVGRSSFLKIMIPALPIRESQRILAVSESKDAIMALVEPGNTEFQALESNLLFFLVCSSSKLTLLILFPHRMLFKDSLSVQLKQIPKWWLLRQTLEDLFGLTLWVLKINVFDRQRIHSQCHNISHDSLVVLLTMLHISYLPWL